VHRDHFERLRTHEPRERVRQLLVIWQPRTRGCEMSFDRELGPVLQFLVEHASNAAWLQSKRVAAQINALAARMSRNEKLGTQVRQGIGGILLFGEGALDG